MKEKDNGKIMIKIPETKLKSLLIKGAEDDSAAKYLKKKKVKVKGSSTAESHSK